jgi:general secretion pathway protein N
MAGGFMNPLLVFALALIAGGICGSPTSAAPTTAEGRIGNPATISPEEGAPRGNLLWTVPLKTLTATRERPIFRPSRRPSAVPLAGSEPTMKIDPAPESPRLALIGTVAGTGEGIAVFVNPATRDMLRLRTGEGYEGWTVREVRGREVVLERGREIVVFALPAAADEKK